METAEWIREHDGVRCRITRVLRECRLRSPSTTGVPAEAFDVDEQRAAGAFSRFFRSTRGGDKHEIVVSHGNMIRYLVSRVLTGSAEHWWRLFTLNCGITEVAVLPTGELRLMSYNDVGHLPADLVTAGLPSGKPAAQSGQPARTGRD